MISLLLVEDHDVFAEALVRVLEGKKDMQVVKVAETAEEALEVFPGLDIDLALIDVSLPRMSGIDLVGRLQKINPQMPCLMISGHMSSNYVRRSLEAGARGYAIKDSATGIVEAIGRVLNGEIYVSKEVHTFDSL